MGASPIGLEHRNLGPFRKPTIQETLETEPGNSQAPVPQVPLQIRPTNIYGQESPDSRETGEVIEHGELIKPLKKDYPKDWPKFSGEGKRKRKKQ